MPTVRLPDGRSLPALGLGTWRMGERSAARATEIAVIRHALDQGLTLFDTAEMYGDGGAETVLGEALAGRRDAAFIVSKVLPSNASYGGTLAACARSLQRLRTEYIDLYLLHWRGGVPLAETVAAFEHLRSQGKIGGWGVSNFDTDDLTELAGVQGGAQCQTNQVYYALAQRDPAYALLPAMGAADMPVMAYSPLDEGRLATHPALVPMAQALGVTPSQIALAWLLTRTAQPTGVLAIPKTTSIARLDENLGAIAVRLDADALTALDQVFAPPRRRRPLAMI